MRNGTEIGISLKIIFSLSFIYFRHFISRTYTKKKKKWKNKQQNNFISILFYALWVLIFLDDASKQTHARKIGIIKPNQKTSAKIK